MHFAAIVFAAESRSRCRLSAIRKQAYHVFMKRLVAVALVVAGMAVPVCAQRGGSRGGSSGHSGQSFHAGSASATPHRSSGSTGYGVRRSSGPTAGVPHGFQRGYPRSPIANPGNRDRDHHRRPYVSPYGSRYPYVVAPYAGMIGPGYLGYPDDTGSADSPDAPTGGMDANAGYDQQPPEQDQPMPRGPYLPPSGLSQPPPSPASEEAVTIIFKDGRPPVQIHNYILTRTTLYIQDQQRRNIPVDQLDLVATGKTNREAGIDFQLPFVSR